MFMLRGSGDGTYRGQPWTAGSGVAVLMDLRQPHSYRSNPDDPWEMMWLRLDGPGVAETFQSAIDSAGSIVIPFASEKQVRADFERLLDILEEQRPGNEAWVWHALTGLMANIMAGLGAARGSRSENFPAGIAAAIETIRQNAEKNLSLRELARAAHLSVFHFARSFKNTTGFTPMEYLEKTRINRAQELLASRPQMQLKEIAQAVGYGDPAYFSRVFHKRAGVSPRDYRKSLNG